MSNTTIFSSVGQRARQLQDLVELLFVLGEDHPRAESLMRYSTWAAKSVG